MTQTSVSHFETTTKFRSTVQYSGEYKTRTCYEGWHRGGIFLTPLLSPIRWQRPRGSKYSRIMRVSYVRGCSFELWLCRTYRKLQSTVPVRYSLVRPVCTVNTLHPNLNSQGPCDECWKCVRRTPVRFRWCLDKWLFRRIWLDVRWWLLR